MAKKQPRSRFGKIPLPCKCSLDEYWVHRQAISVSSISLWEMFHCTRCRKAGLIDFSIYYPTYDLYPWVIKHPICQLYMKQFRSKAGPDRVDLSSLGGSSPS